MVGPWGKRGKKMGDILAMKSDFWRNVDKHPRGIRGHNDAIHYLSFINEAFH